MVTIAGSNFLSGAAVAFGGGAATAVTVVGALTITAGGNLDWGTYTPTLTNGSNVAASTAFAAQYLRVGNTVTVSGQCDVDPTAASTATTLGISLPIASALANPYECTGTGANPGGTVPAVVIGDAANDRASLEYTPNTDANHRMSFHFTYRVI